MQDIQDNEIRLIGGGNLPTPNPKRKWKLLIIIAITLITVAVIVSIIISKTAPKQEVISTQTNNNNNTETEPYIEVIDIRQADNPHPLQSWLLACDTITLKTCVIKDSIVNDIPIRIYNPLNAVARLQIGSKCLSDNNTILVAEAADIRADNGKINGAFVLAGTPKAWGLSKKAYCAIIHDSIQVGVSENSPLFEKACETGGYFFRQYALVDNGQVVINQLKTQSRRRALCEIDNHIVIVETLTPVGMFDFSQLLVDIYTVNAIYLIGGETLGFAQIINTRQDKQIVAMNDSVNLISKQLQNINYIYWQ